MASKIARYLLGAAFVVFGINGFLDFLPPPEPTQDGAVFLDLLDDSGFIVVVKLLEITGGLAILSGRYLPLGLTLLGPIVANILLYHLFFDPANIAMGLVVGVLWGFLMWAHRSSFASLFAPPAD